jgi:hypothetical protein
MTELGRIQSAVLGLRLTGRPEDLRLMRTRAVDRGARRSTRMSRAAAELRRLRGPSALTGASPTAASDDSQRSGGAV